MLKWAVAWESALSHMFPLWWVKWLLCLWIDGVSLCRPFGWRHWPAKAPTARGGSFLSPHCLQTAAVPLPPKPKPFQNHGEMGNTCKRANTPFSPGTTACPPATELSGPCSLNAHFVPLSTGLIDINSCAQSAHSVFSWSDAVGVCVWLYSMATSFRWGWNMSSLDTG